MNTTLPTKTQSARSSTKSLSNICQSLQCPIPDYMREQESADIQQWTPAYEPAYEQPVEPSAIEQTNQASKIGQKKKQIIADDIASDKNFLTQLLANLEGFNTENQKPKFKSFYAKESRKLNQTKMAKMLQIVGYLERLAELIRSF